MATQVSPFPSRVLISSNVHPVQGFTVARDAANTAYLEWKAQHGDNEAEVKKVVDHVAAVHTRDIPLETLTQITAQTTTIALQFSNLV